MWALKAESFCSFRNPTRVRMSINFVPEVPSDRNRTARPSSQQHFPPRFLFFIFYFFSMISASLAFTSARALAFASGGTAVMQRGFVAKSPLLFEMVRRGRSTVNHVAPCGSSTDQMLSRQSRHQLSMPNTILGCSPRVALLFPCLRPRRGLATLRGGAPSQEKETEGDWMESDDLQDELSAIVSEISARIAEGNDEQDKGDWTALAERVEAASEHSIAHYRSLLQQEEEEERRGREDKQEQRTARGLFVLFEGLDRSGKSTQVARLAEALRLEGDDVWVTCFPCRSSPTGQLLDLALRARLSLSPHALHLLFAANRWEAASAIRHARKQGRSIVMDRYSASGIAYSAAKGLDLAWCQQAEQGLPQPDLTLFLDIAPDVAASRPGYGNEVFERVEFQGKVRAAYMRLRDPLSWTLLPAQQEEGAIASQVQEALARCRQALARAGGPGPN